MYDSMYKCGKAAAHAIVSSHPTLDGAQGQGF